jgi:hypothetical protein
LLLLLSEPFKLAPLFTIQKIPAGDLLVHVRKLGICFERFPRHVRGEAVDDGARHALDVFPPLRGDAFQRTSPRGDLSLILADLGLDVALFLVLAGLDSVA